MRFANCYSFFAELAEHSKKLLEAAAVDHFAVESKCLSFNELEEI